MDTNELKIFALVNDEDYDWKGELIHLKAGDTFTGGKVCAYPAARDYFVVRDHKRIWFRKELVEGHPERFERVFP